MPIWMEQPLRGVISISGDTISPCFPLCHFDPILLAHSKFNCQYGRVEIRQGKSVRLADARLPALWEPLVEYETTYIVYTAPKDRDQCRGTDEMSEWT